MGLKAFSIFDSKAGVYSTPFMMQSVGVAMRTFADIVNDPSEQMAKHPEDYTLFECADFDEDSGLFIPLSTPHSLGNGIELKLAPGPDQEDLNLLNLRGTAQAEVAHQNMRNTNGQER